MSKRETGPQTGSKRHTGGSFRHFGKLAQERQQGALPILGKAHPAHTRLSTGSKVYEDWSFKNKKTGVSFPSSPSTQPGQRSGQRLPVGNTVLPSPPSTFTLSRLFWLLLRLAVSLLKTWGRCSTSRWFNVQISLRKLLLGIDASASIPQTVMEHLFLAKFCAAGLRKQQFPSAMCPRARPSCYVHK